MKLSVPISDNYRAPIYVALGLQVITVFLSPFAPDHGEFTQFACMAATAFWGSVVVLVARRPRTPTRTDLLWVRYGYLAAVAVAYVVAPIVWCLRGVI